MNLQQWKKTGVLRLEQDDFNDPGTMSAVNHLLNKQQDQWIEEIQALASSLDISHEFAICVSYLRTRSRWCQDYENRLIQMARNGEQAPNMNEWPSDHFEKRT